MTVLHQDIGDTRPAAVTPRPAPVTPGSESERQVVAGRSGPPRTHARVHHEEMTQIPFEAQPSQLGPEGSGAAATAPGLASGRAPEGPAENVWVAAVRRNPDHARGYAERWRRIEAAGEDIYGEARLIDAMAPRGARVLDAGCGSGRLGGYLALAGHHVTGVDLDPHLIEVAQEDHPQAQWYVGDLAQLDLREHGAPPVLAPGDQQGSADEEGPGDEEGPRDAEGPAGERVLFDLALCAGNVLTFLSVAERRPALSRLAEHLRPTGRLVAGFGLGRGYLLEDFEADVRASGLFIQQRFSSWDLQPPEADPGFMVAVLTRA